MQKRRALNIPGSLAAVVAEYLEKEFIEGRIKPGERLTEQKWAIELGISRGSFREVLRILADAGLVEILPRRGARVRTLSKREVEEIYFLKKHLEGIAAAKAAENMSEERLADFEKVLGKMQEAAKQTDLATYIHYNLLFREMLLEVAGSDRLKRILDYLGKPAIRYRYLGLESPGRLAISLRLHEETFRALAERDSERAAKAIFHLIETAGQAIVKKLGSDSDSQDVPPAQSGQYATPAILPRHNHIETTSS